MSACIEERTAVDWRVSLEGEPVGSFPSKAEARRALFMAMRHRYGLIPAREGKA